MELAALEVPIRTTGAQQVKAALQDVETAGRKAGQTLEQTAAKTATVAKQQYSRMGADAVRAIAAETNKGRVAIEQQGAQLAQSLTAGLRRQFARQRAEIKEELARGLITPAEAQRRGQQAAQAFNRGVLQVIRTQGDAGNFRGRQGGALFVGLSNQLVGLDRNARRGAAGLRTLASQMASIAAMEIGLRAGFGSMASILGTLALGSAVTLGVVAGLAAIALAIRRITSDSREAKERIREFREESQKLIQARQRQDPAFLRDEAGAAEAIAVAAERTAREKRVAAEKAFRDMESANVKQLDDARARATKLRQEADKAEADARAARTQATERSRVATEAETDAIQKREQAVISLIGIGRTEAVVLAEREKLLAALNAQLANTTGLEERARLEERIHALQEAGKKKTKEAKDETEKHVRALTDLMTAGLATADDLAELSRVQDSLKEATRQGTVEARAQASALLEVVQAARLAAVELAILRAGQTLAIEPRMSQPDTQPRRAAPRTPDEELQRRGFVTAFPTVDVGAMLDEQFANLPQHTQDLFLFREELAAAAEQMASMPSVLQLGADAWLAFWDAIGAGEGIGESVKKMFSGVARYFAQYFAAKALAAAAEALLPPPLGNPAAAGAIPLFLAASAAFAALGGATGGGRHGGAGSASSRTPRERFMFEEHLQPRLRPGGTSPTAGTASQVRPIQPQTFNFAVIGPNDPVAQKQIAMLVTNASRRGYRTA